MRISYFCPVVSSFSSVFSSPNLSCHRLDVYHTSTHVRIYNAGLKRTAYSSTKTQDTKKTPKIPHLCPIAQLCQAIFSQIRQHIDNWKKNWLNSNTSSKCPHNMVNFGLLTAETGSGVWGTPANVNGFRILATLLHSTLVVGINQTLRH